MDEEAQKRNTDCVYFLASPLTCKKGSGCEYRHSEAARKNPRDCWYWFNGNCLNLICPFRHPPLDGRPSASTAAPKTSAAPTTSPLPVVTATQGSANKSKTSCYYFSQGYCAKGEKCSFMHGPVVMPAVDAHQKLSKTPASQGIDKSKAASAAKGGNGSVAANKDRQQELLPMLEKKTTTGSNGHVSTSPPPMKVASSANHTERVSKSKNAMVWVPPNYQEDGKMRGNDKPEQTQDSIRKSWQGQSKERKVETRQLGGDDWHQLQSSNEGFRQSMPRQDGKQNGPRSAVWLRETSPGVDESSKVFEHKGYPQMRLSEQGTSVDNGGQPTYDEGSFDRSTRQQTFHYNSRSCSLRDRPGWKFEQAHAGGDLRDHLMKRRKNEASVHISTENHHYAEASKQQEYGVSSGRTDQRGFKRSRLDDYGASSIKQVATKQDDFEAPKPFSVILKEKRKAELLEETVVVGASGNLSKDQDQVEGEVLVLKSAHTSVSVDEPAESENGDRHDAISDHDGPNEIGKSTQRNSSAEGFMHDVEDNDDDEGADFAKRLGGFFT